MSISIVSVFFLIICGGLLLLPTIIAVVKEHPNKIPIAIVNILGGMFFGLGWIAALIWCFIDTEGGSQRKERVANELESLYALVEKEAMSREEYEKKKQQLLSS